MKKLFVSYNVISRSNSSVRGFGNAEISEGVSKISGYQDVLNLEKIIERDITPGFFVKVLHWQRFE